jgi:hypothetical protein
MTICISWPKMPLCVYRTSVDDDVVVLEIAVAVAVIVAVNVEETKRL